MIGRRNTQILPILRGIQHVQFDLVTKGESRSKFLARLLPKHFLRLFTAEGFYHMDILSVYDKFVKAQEVQNYS